MILGKGGYHAVYYNQSASGCLNFHFNHKGQLPRYDVCRYSHNLGRYPFLLADAVNYSDSSDTVPIISCVGPFGEH